LELIDFGLEEIQQDEDEEVWYIYTPFEEFGNMSKGLETLGIEPITSELQRIALSEMEVPEELVEDVIKLIERIEEDDDVQNVYHNMK